MDQKIIWYKRISVITNKGNTYGEITYKDQDFPSVTAGFLLLLWPLLQGVTVLQTIFFFENYIFDSYKILQSRPIPGLHLIPQCVKDMLQVFEDAV